MVGDFPLPLLTRERLQDTGKQNAPLFSRAYARYASSNVILLIYVEHRHAIS